MLRVRSSERTWLHSRSPSKLSKPERDDQQIVVALRGVEQAPHCGSVSTSTLVLAAQHRGDMLVRGWPIVDDENAAAAAGLGDRLALRALDADIARSHGAHAQLVGHHLEAGERAHARDQRDIGYRLGQEIVGAGLEPLDPIGRLVERRHHDHRNMVRRRLGS